MLAFTADTLRWTSIGSLRGLEVRVVSAERRGGLIRHEPPPPLEDVYQSVEEFLQLVGPTPLPRTQLASLVGVEVRILIRAPGQTISA